MRRMADALVEAMGRLLDERIPAAGGRGPPHCDPRGVHDEESGGENSGLDHGFDRFAERRGGHSGERRAYFHHQRGGRRDHERRVRFEDEEFVDHDEEERPSDDENPFGRGGRFGRCHRHRRADFADRGYNRGRHHHDDPDNNARVKLNIPKFTGKENADGYLEWAEQCDQIFRVHNFSDQRRVNLASVEFSGYVLTWWNQVQENQLELGLGYINTWEGMKQVMRRRFVPSSHQRDLRNRLQMLKQGKRYVDEYFKEMELLLVRTGIIEDAESKMARFLGGLNEDIAGFVEMLPYHTLQDLVDQAMHTEKKIQQESRGKSYGSQSISAPWRK
jgi:hypothetical protein